MGKQIATYKNRVKTLVPGYDLAAHSRPNPETITVTKNSVEEAQYASWSQNEEQEGMYIKQYSIGDVPGKTEYSDNQLVAIVDLEYRYLSPINGRSYPEGDLPYQLENEGCIKINNTNKTIEKDTSYEFKITPKNGFSIVPAGHVEVKTGDNIWTPVEGASWPETEITEPQTGITVLITADKIVGSLRFILEDCKYKIVAHKVVDGGAQDVDTLTSVQTCNGTPITINDIKNQFDDQSLNYAGATKDRAGTTQADDTYLQNCGGNRDVYLNYTTKTYGITLDIPNCVNYELTSNGRPVNPTDRIRYGEPLTIVLTPGQDYVTIGPGRITMVGQQSPVEEWGNNRARVEKIISEVTGDINISASCGDLAEHDLTLILWNDEESRQEGTTKTVSNIQHGTSITPRNYLSLVTGDVPFGYSIVESPYLDTPIIVDSNKTITYHCALNEYTVTFVAGSGVALEQGVGGTVKHGKTFTQENVYTVNPEYSVEDVSATVTAGTAGNPVCGNRNSVSIPNVQSNITVTISALRTYHISFAFDDSDAGNLSTNSVPVVEGSSCAEEISYTLNTNYTLDRIEILPSGDGVNTSSEAGKIKICAPSGRTINGDMTVTIYTNPPRTVTYVFYDENGDEVDNHSVKVPNNGTTEYSYTYQNIDLSEYDVETEVTAGSISRVNKSINGSTVTVTGTPIVSDATIEITLTAKRQLDSIDLSASEMDAMGGVIFTATKNYSDGTSEIDDTQSNFSVSYTDWKGNQSTAQDIVDVYDHVDKEVQTKSKLNYENPTTSSKTNIPVRVTYNDGVNTEQDDLQINQRAEVYGYYSGITAESSTSELDSTKWTTSELLDFGDGVQMFNGSGNDIYNKDITPYQIPGTYIGENPLNHLDNNVSFISSTGIIISSSASHNYNSINSEGHGEHYHIAWNNEGRNGYLFDYDGMSMGDSFCGGHIGTCTGCHETGYTDSSRATLEAFSPPSKNGISRTPTIEYGIYYVSPQHRYGADSISYYHYKNKEYKSSIVNSPFKDTNYETIEFKYPVHIQLLEKKDKEEELTSWPTATSYGAGPTSYGMRTTRWSIDGDIEPYPDSDVYITYSDGSGYYYDFENKITLHGDNSVNFAPYNNAYYVESEESHNDKEDAANNQDGGRYVGIYNSLMSAETLIRPYYENSQWKYIVLNAEYNGVNYDNFQAASRLKKVDMSEYVQHTGIRTRYISGYALNYLNIVPSGMTVPSTYEPIKENGVELVEYPYYVDMNTDYSSYVDSNGSYQDATAYDSSLNHAHRLFNVSDYVNYNQYRNSPECAEHYLSNSDDAKYTICTTEFKKYDYRKYYPSSYTENSFNWTNIFRDIASITESSEHHGYYDITLNNGTVYNACSQSTLYKYYPSQEIEVGTFWTNGDFVDIQAISCGGKIGSFRAVVHDASTGSVIEELTKDCSWEGTANTLSLGRDYPVKDLQVTIYANTNRVGQANDLSDPNYTSNVYTGGCSFQIVSQWSNGPGTPYRQFMWTYIGGSCDKTNNPDKSGADISWEDMYEYYQYSDGTPFNNAKSLDLIPKKDPDFNS